MGSLRPILVYDETHRRLRFADEGHARALLSELLYLLRSRGLDHADELLRHWLSIPRPLQYVIPRFHIENFGPLHLLGSGGFGTVFRAQHKLDGREYAIKVVRGIRSPRDLELARSEVRLMAQLDHVNVVQYMTSWVEYGFTYVPLANQIAGEGSVSTTSGRSTPALPSSEEPSSGSPDSIHEFDANRIDRVSPIVDEPVSNGNDRRQLAVRHNSRSSFRQRQSPEPVLFIQLELCEYNLAQWIDYRNRHVVERHHESTSQASHVLLPHASARWIADQLARGVAYLHANQMMHRDLKPENVLLSGPPLNELSYLPCGCGSTQPAGTVLSDVTCDSPRCYHQLTVKICDFGLAKFLQPSPPVLSSLSLSPSATNSSQVLDEGPSTSNPISSRLTMRSNIDQCGDRPGYVTTSNPPQTSLPHVEPVPDGNNTFLLTADLGSSVYAAPEVSGNINGRILKRVPYNYKADIFSMGVIFLQLFHRFGTLHELIRCLQPLSRRNPVTLPNGFLSCWTAAKQMVLAMLDLNPDNRPSASEVSGTLCSRPETTSSSEGQTNSTTAPADSSPSASLPFTADPEMHRLVDRLTREIAELKRENAELKCRLLSSEESRSAETANR